MNFWTLLRLLFLLSLLDVVAPRVLSPGLCPAYRALGRCKKRSCKGSGVEGTFQIPPSAATLVAAAREGADVEDDVALAGGVRVAQRRTAARCCRKCSESNRCATWQWLDLGDNGGLCFQYEGRDGPTCGLDTDVITRVGMSCMDPHNRNGNRNSDRNGDTRDDSSGALLPSTTFCALSDRRLHVNMRLEGYLRETERAAALLKGGREARGWVREVGVMWHAGGEGHSLRLAAREGREAGRREGFLAMATVDGVKVERMQVEDEAMLEGGLSLTLEAVENEGKVETEVYRVKITDLLDMELRIRPVNPRLRTPDDAYIHFNLGINWINTTPSIRGVLSKAYRGAQDGRDMELQEMAALLHHLSAPELHDATLAGETMAHVSSGIVDPDCQVSSYQGYDSTIRPIYENAQQSGRFSLV